MRIHIERYPVYIQLGCLPSEKVCGQEVFITLCIKLSKAAFSEIKWQNDFLDYGKVLASIDSCLVGRQIELIETAVLDLGGRLMEEFSGIEELQVKILKPKIPGGIARGASISVEHDFSRVKKEYFQ